MNHHLYEMEYAAPVKEVLEELRKKIADTTMGVTLVGNRLTIRWGNPMRQVHMAILEVEDGDTKHLCPVCEGLRIIRKQGKKPKVCPECEGDGTSEVPK